MKEQGARCQGRRLIRGLENACWFCAGMALVAALLVFAIQAKAEDAYGPYKLKAWRAYDGDTVEAVVRLWPGQCIQTKIRLHGIDAPEIRTRRECEKADALHAKAYLQALLDDADHVELLQVENGKYAGRVLGDLLIDGHDAGQIMLREGLARPYNGGPRKAWDCRDG